MSARFPSIPNAIQWHDGMMLTPQHFDDLTARLEALIEHASRMAAPFNWGVATLSIGEAELLEGTFSVTELEAILPDGLAVWTDTRSQAPLKLQLDTLEPAFKSGIFTVYAAVPAPREGADRLWRYEPVEEPIEQQAANDESDAPPIPRLQPRLQLIATPGALPSRYVGVPLAQLQYRNGAFARVDSYIPPTQKLRTTSPVARQTISLLRRVREVSIVLQQQWRSLSSSERESQDLARRSAVQQLVATLPYAEAIVEVGEVHPFQVFLALTQMAGHVAGIASDPIPPNFQPYNHLNLANSFSEVITFITRVLAENTSEDYIGVPFLPGDDSFYLLFEPSWKGRKLVLALAAPDLPADQVKAWGNSALIGASILQDSMRDRRILGARRAFTEREQGLYTPPGTVLFQLFNDDEFIRGGEMLEITGGKSQRGIGKPADMTLFVMQA